MEHRFVTSASAPNDPIIQALGAIGSPYHVTFYSIVDAIAPTAVCTVDMVSNDSVVHWWFETDGALTTFNKESFETRGGTYLVTGTYMKGRRHPHKVVRTAQVTVTEAADRKKVAAIVRRSILEG